MTEVSTRSQAVGSLNVNISTTVIRPLRCEHFTTNVKMIIDNHDLKCENGLRGGGYGSGNRTSDVSILFK